MSNRLDINSDTKIYPLRQIHDGEEVLIKDDEIERVICCDCSLVHDVQYRIIDEHTVGITVWRNNRSTGQHRRHNND